jgi:mannose-6-phosphate isomerase-like protein (cupin superfamily)
MLFKLSNAKEVQEEGFTAFLYNLKSDFPSFNTVYVDCHKFHEEVYVKRSHRIYFVIEGSGTFTVDRKKNKTQKNDVIVIEPMTKYSYKGKMKLFEVNFPATNSEDEVKTE